MRDTTPEKRTKGHRATARRERSATAFRLYPDFDGVLDPANGPNSFTH